MIHNVPVADYSILAQTARILLPASIGIAVIDPRVQTITASHLKMYSLAKMVPSRQREFVAGRTAAHAAMIEIGQTPQPIPMGNDRAPIWTKGLVGSISHTAEFCIALVGLQTQFAALGVDLEPNAPLDKDLIPEILTKNEADWLARQPLNDQPYLVRLIFSAKECAYKCQYPLTRQIFGFDGFDIQLDQTQNHFQARFTRRVGSFVENHILTGRFDITQNLILTTMAIHADGTSRIKE